MSTFALITPCYNEGEVILNFLNQLKEALVPLQHDFIVCVVDDNSTDQTPEILAQYTFSNPKLELHVIRLNYNSGHQEAIRQGLIFVNTLKHDLSGVMVMDSDGEDDVNAIEQLIRETQSEIVFVERGKRQEKISFKLGYIFYKSIFRLATGSKISFGNFSMISADLMKTIAGQKFFHYASFLSKQKVSNSKIKWDRLERIDGKSKMNYQSLVFHGLYSIIEYAEEILFSFMKFFLLLFAGLLGYTAYVLYAKFVSQVAIPGWTSAILSSLIIASLIILSTLILGLILLSLKKLLLLKDQNYERIK